MRTLVLFLSHPKALLLAAGVAWLEVIVIPNPVLIFVLLGAMMIDLLTGLLKSWNEGKATTSNGFRKSVIKFTTYACAIIGMWFLAVLLKQMYGGFDYTILVNLTICILSLIELYSVFENVNAISPNSMLSKYLAKPVLKGLRGLLKQADKSLEKSLENGTDTEDTQAN